MIIGDLTKTYTSVWSWETLTRTPEYTSPKFPRSENLFRLKDDCVSIPIFSKLGV